MLHGTSTGHQPRDGIEISVTNNFDDTTKRVAVREIVGYPSRIIENLNTLTGCDIADFVAWRRGDIRHIPLQKRLSTVRVPLQWLAEPVDEELSEKFTYWGYRTGQSRGIIVGKSGCNYV